MSAISIQKELSARVVKDALEAWAEYAYSALAPLFHRSSAVRTFQSIGIGETVRTHTCITRAKVFFFALASGDWNPLHFNRVFASKTRFGRPIAHGMLIASSISALLARELPGEGTLYESQTLDFIAPVYVGDTVTTEVAVVGKDERKRRIVLECRVYREQEPVLVGTAVVRTPVR